MVDGASGEVVRSLLGSTLSSQVAGAPMKPPEKTTVKQRLVLTESSTEPFNLSGVAAFLEENPHLGLKNIMVEFVPGYYGEDGTIKLYALEHVPNPDYELELRKYEAHIEFQRKERIAWKLKAKTELELKIAKIQAEIAELNSGTP